MAINNNMAITKGTFIQFGFMLLAFTLASPRHKRRIIFLKPLYGTNEFFRHTQNDKGNSSLREPNIRHFHGFQHLQNCSLPSVEQCYIPAQDDVHNGQRYGSGRIWWQLWITQSSKHFVKFLNLNIYDQYVNKYTKNCKFIISKCRDLFTSCDFY